MTDETALTNRALEAADDVLRRMADALRADPSNEGQALGDWLERAGGPIMRPLLAVAWLEGRQAGGHEAQTIIRQAVAELGGA
jgi:hypothetical protein